MRGPWELTPIARTVWSGGASVIRDEKTPLPQGGRLNPVGDWGPLLGDFRGRVEYRRAFHQPTGISGQDVYLVIDGVDSMGEATLNGKLLGSIHLGESKEWNITDEIRPNNRLTLVIDLPACSPNEPPFPRPDRDSDAPGGLIGQVRLEIRTRRPADDSAS